MANNGETRQYVALTTTSGKAGIWVEMIGEPGESKEAVEERAMRGLCGDQWDGPKDIYVDTMCKNLFVLSASAAKRAFPRAWANYHTLQTENALRPLADRFGGPLA